MIRATAVISLVLGLSAWTGLGATTAEVMDVDLHSRALGPARWDGRTCSVPDGCLYRYRFHVQNTSDTMVYVAECTLSATDGAGNSYSSTGSAGAFPAGTSLQPGRAADLNGRVAFPTEGPPSRSLDITTISCAAWDWHGEPPI